MSLGISIVGSQWGDEGKGKIVDSLTNHLAKKRPICVVRYQGGANAGHTVIVGNKKYILHLVPAGILQPNVTCIIGNGTVIDPFSLVEELDNLKTLGFDLNQLLISAQAHLVLPYNKALDAAREAYSSGNKIGTTKRGIGPTYADKASRLGIRFEDLHDPKKLDKKLTCIIEEKNALLTYLGASYLCINSSNLLKELEKVYQKLSPFIRNDTGSIIRNMYNSGVDILYEGAQGIMLDIDHGTYPYVTSSHPGSNGVASGAGVPISMINEIYGVAKCYTTRVGKGPFPTELAEEDSAALRKRGNEFGATTGRPRRCGWLDLKQLRYATELIGTTGIVLTKLDTLSGLNTLKVCINYELPKHYTNIWEQGIPIYKEFEPIPDIDWSKIKTIDNLPQEAKTYIEFIEEYLNTKVKYISTGPERDALLNNYL